MQYIDKKAPNQRIREMGCKPIGGSFKTCPPWEVHRLHTNSRQIYGKEMLEAVFVSASTEGVYNDPVPCYKHFLNRSDSVYLIRSQASSMNQWLYLQLSEIRLWIPTLQCVHTCLVSSLEQDLYSILLNGSESVAMSTKILHFEPRSSVLMWQALRSQISKSMKCCHSRRDV